jgi:3-deoxy-D-manno-octulosonic-acid transferase
MRSVYRILIRILAPIAAAVTLLRAVRDPAYRAGFAERFGFGPARGAGAAIWLHAVSLGEVVAAGPLVRALRERHPRQDFVITTATPTGRAKARSAFGDDVDVRYLPYDTPGAVARFLDRVHPRLGVIMETELWPNLFEACARRGIPLVLASARLSARSVVRYRRGGALFRGLFGPGVAIAAQTEADAGRFRRIGADPARTRVLGNVKFDLEVDPTLPARASALRAGDLGARPTWVAGSTHAGEERPVLEAHRDLLRSVPDALLILAPRHPQRFDAVVSLLQGGGWRFARRSEGGRVPPQIPVLLLDTIGELPTYYAAADVAFVGGSLVPIGGHNLLEPAAVGVPVLTGPSIDNAREAAALLTAAGAVRIVADAAELGVQVARWLADPAERARIGAIGRRTVAMQRGSVARLVDWLDSGLGPIATDGDAGAPNSNNGVSTDPR